MATAVEHNATILVVDDEESLTDLVSSALRFAGYTVRSEDNGFDALRAVKEQTPDLIVLDVNMPEMDGFEVCRRLRRDGNMVPVIFLTEHASVRTAVLAMRGGALHFLEKPLPLEELREAIHTYYAMAGWDKETGVPTVEKLYELDIGWAAEYLQQ